MERKENVFAAVIWTIGMVMVAAFSYELWQDYSTTNTTNNSFFKATVVKSQVNTVLWITENIIVAVPVDEDNEKENRIVLHTTDSSYMVGDTIVVKYNGERYTLSSNEEKAKYERKIEKQKEEDELDNPNMIQGMNNTIQGIRTIPENTKVKVEYRYSIEYKDDTGKIRTVKCFGYKERPKYYELVYQYENTSGIAYIKKENCIKISDIDETEIIELEQNGD